ncbi:isoprenyl transferase [soil metagenome]
MTSKAKDADVQKNLKQSGEIPRHIAIIMDGNGRWAKSKGYNRVLGHNEGVNSARDIIESCAQIGVKYLTLYTFSTENWKRPKSEVSVLMSLLIKVLGDETERLHKENIKIAASGDLSSLPEKVMKVLTDGMERTKNNDKMTLNIAISYSGRWDILNAMKKIYKEVSNGKIQISDINEENFGSYLATQDIPDPDLLIRTGGDYRISNFLLWQIAYSEIYIDQIFWPDFKRNNLYNAISEFQKRERRYGMTSEQIIKS